MLGSAPLSTAPLSATPTGAAASAVFGDDTEGFVATLGRAFAVAATASAIGVATACATAITVGSFGGADEVVVPYVPPPVCLGDDSDAHHGASALPRQTTITTTLNATQEAIARACGALTYGWREDITVPYTLPALNIGKARAAQIVYALNPVTNAVTWSTDLAVTSINTTTDVFTTNSHGHFTNSCDGPFYASTTGTFPNLTAGGSMDGVTPYWIKAVDANTYKVATSQQNAATGTFLDLSSSGTGTLTFLRKIDTLTTGSAFIIATARGVWSAGSTTVVDNKGNDYPDYDQSFAYVSFPDSKVRVRIDLSATGGSGHTVTAANADIGGAGDEPTAVIVEVEGAVLLKQSVHSETAVGSSPITAPTLSSTAEAIFVYLLFGNGPVGQQHVFTPTDASWLVIPNIDLTADVHPNGYIQCTGFYRKYSGATTVAPQFTPTSSEGCQWFGFVFQQIDPPPIYDDTQALTPRILWSPLPPGAQAYRDATDPLAVTPSVVDDDAGGVMLPRLPAPALVTLAVLTALADDQSPALYGQPGEDFWTNAVAPLPGAIRVQLPLQDVEVLPAGAFYGQPDEDFWTNAVAPVPAFVRVQLPLGDPEELPAGGLRGQPDEDFWTNAVAPVPATLRVQLPLTEVDAAPAGAFYGQPDEDFWTNAVAPVPAYVRVQLPLQDVEVLPGGTFYGQPDEDFWTNAAAPIPAYVRVQLPLQDVEVLPAGVLHGPFDDDPRTLPTLRDVWNLTTRFDDEIIVASALDDSTWTRPYVYVTRDIQPLGGVDDSFAATVALDTADAYAVTRVFTASCQITSPLGVSDDLPRAPTTVVLAPARYRFTVMLRRVRRPGSC